MDVVGSMRCDAHAFRSLPSTQLLVSVRPAIGRVDFPSKRLNVAEIGAMVSERVDLLQKFLRKVSSLVCINSLHPSTAKVQLALQQFLEVTDRMDNIAILESRQPTMSEKNMVQVFVHSVMQMACLDKVYAHVVVVHAGHAPPCPRTCTHRDFVVHLHPRCSLASWTRSTKTTPRRPCRRGSGGEMRTGAAPSAPSRSSSTTSRCVFAP